MEDCFVAAQEGKVRFASEQIEVLLRGVDMLLRMAQDTAVGTEQGLSAHDTESEPCVGALSALLLAAPTPSPPAPASPLHASHVPGTSRRPPRNRPRQPGQRCQSLSTAAVYCA